ncbi:type II secretion system protein M [Endozoicomonas euniceicola]|uniref:Type II secretion system protein M n=1 Tax=Endozoicomonas euniceicola TaxID=1234143 RepID=A0ABY6GRM9_9GAMM|nr:type II secretion system protein M [Endozoicomonas euniceicola]UYM15404.1 type II secretion system protein M [Endozoicomonas euniceicola]
MGMQKLMAEMQENPLWQQLQARYELLSSRDRQALQWLSAFLAAALLYLFIWEPLSSWNSSQKEDYERQQVVLQWMNDNYQSAKDQQRKQKTAGGQREISSIVSGTAKQAGVTLSRVQPDRKGLGVWIEDAAYQKFLSWLVVLNTKFNLTVQQVRLDKGKEEGRVKIYLHLSN